MNTTTSKPLITQESVIRILNAISISQAERMTVINFFVIKPDYLPYEVTAIIEGTTAPKEEKNKVKKVMQKLAKKD